MTPTAKQGCFGFPMGGCSARSTTICGLCDGYYCDRCIGQHYDIDHNAPSLDPARIKPTFRVEQERRREMGDHLDDLRSARLEEKQAELEFLAAARGLARERMGRNALVSQKTYDYFDGTWLTLLKAEKAAK